jgi:hypothetical protein
VPRCLPRALTRIRALAADGRLTSTDKARVEMQQLGLGREDVRQILLGLTWTDEPARLRSGPGRGWLYAFRPSVPGLRLYLKVAVRKDCVVISCHEDEPQAQGEADRDE